MVHHDMSLQDAIDHLVEKCPGKAELIQEILKTIPSFGDKVDRDVASYVQGVEDLIQATIHWYFMT